MGRDPEAMPGHLLPQSRRSTWAQGAGETPGLGGVVQQIVTRSLRDGYPDVDSVAKILGLSARTLQRRLSDEGVTYARVVARARLDVAQRMLEDPACKVIEVALDLGYSDPAHFARAFARWTGLAPREFRRLRASGCRSGEFPDENLVSAGSRALPSRESPGHRPDTAAAGRDFAAT
jgi:AraC-like DNA-binding protein